MNGAILGISAYYHDSAAALLLNGTIVAAAHEERFSRIKHDASFPHHAVTYVLEEAGLRIDELDLVAFYDKPLLKFERLLETYHAFAPKGFTSFLSAMPVWVKEKLFMRRMLKEAFTKIGSGQPKKLLFPEHHLSHAASAFYPSPFEEAAILTLDGVGEWATTVIGHGQDNAIDFLRQANFPHSLGLLYSAFTYYCGFKVNSGEYKLMGLAPYGNPNSQQTQAFIQTIFDKLIDLRPDGSFLLNMTYFTFATELRMCDDKAWTDLFGIPPRQPESDLPQDYMNLAFAIQHVTKTIVLQLAKTAQQLTGSKNLVMAGGVALNCVANGKLLETGMFDDIWIQPAAGDAGGALGAALAAWHIHQEKPRRIQKPDAMQGAYLGPQFDQIEVERIARRYQAPFQTLPFEQLYDQVTEYLADGKVVGWFQGRMEYGPRALGNRSILGDPRDPDMQKKLNLKIKYREGFRPFAPSVLEEDLETWFDLDVPTPYMLLVAPVAANQRHPLPDAFAEKPLYERLYHQRSHVPAITHVDYSARIQSVNQKTNPHYHALISAFKKRTGCGMLVNTSFNVRGEPIVCHPRDAYRCFMNTEMDALVIGNALFDKTQQPPWLETPLASDLPLD